MKRILKIIGFSILGIILFLVLVIGYFYLSYYIEQKEKEKVEITVEYDPDECSSYYPLAVRILNGSKRTILYTDTRINIYRKGYSKDIAQLNSGLETDKIIESNESYRFCVNILLEELYKSISVDELEFKIGYTYIRFK